MVGETIGYSLKYDITGGALYYSVIEISEDQLSIQYSYKTFKDSFSDKYDTPIFIFYQETLDKMIQDDFLDNYSGIKDLDLDTIGTIVTVIGKSTNFHDKYEAIPTKFIIIKYNCCSTIYILRIAKIRSIILRNKTPCFHYLVCFLKPRRHDDRGGEPYIIEQFNVLTKDYYEAAKLSREKIKEVTFTYDELFGDS